MRLRNRIILTALTQYFLITYYLMLVSISTDYWTDDGKSHEGLWMKCLYNTNISSMYNLTCCSSRPFKDHIGAAGFFLIFQLVLDTLFIVLWFIWLFLKKKNYYEQVYSGVYYNIFTKRLTIGMNCLRPDKTEGCLFIIIVLSAYGGIESKSLGWSFHLLLSVLFLRIPCYILLCKVVCDEEKDEDD